MKHRYLLPVIFILGFLQSCNTLYNTTLIDLEIIEPAKVIFPPNVKKIAVRYNNSNISYNPIFAKYATANKVRIDPENSDPSRATPSSRESCSGPPAMTHRFNCFSVSGSSRSRGV